jgi:hypothetical protein
VGPIADVERVLDQLFVGVVVVSCGKLRELGFDLEELVRTVREKSVPPFPRIVVLGRAALQKSVEGVELCSDPLSGSELRNRCVSLLFA